MVAVHKTRLNTHTEPTLATAKANYTLDEIPKPFLIRATPVKSMKIH